MGKASGNRVIGLTTALSLVVANMVGTGLFTTTGLLIASLPDPVAVLLLWLAGGIVALCGALTYGELGAVLPRSGGEYHFLSRLLHPAAGFLAGWVSLVVGFSAPVAAVAVAFSKYVNSMVTIPELPLAIFSVVCLSAVHMWNIRYGSKVQNIITALKAPLLLILLAGGAWVTSGESLKLDPVPFQPHNLLSPAFATGLIFVMYAYSGWNAAAYLAGEIKNPAKNLPKALVGGTLIVTLIYLLVNYFFLAAVPAQSIAGKVEVGHYVAKEVFGNTGSIIMSSMIAIFLLSSLSSMIMAGPRVYKTMGEDYKMFKILTKKSGDGAPQNAIILQLIITIIFILSFAFETILVYVGFTLSLFAGLTVATVFVLRIKHKNLLQKKTYKTWGYPVTPMLFLMVMGWMILHAIREKPEASLAGIVTLAIGGILYYLSGKYPNANR